VRRGEVVLDLSFLASWGEELEEMNANKRGRPFRFPRSLIRFIVFARYVWRLGLRQAEGLLRVLGTMLGFDAPDYTTLWRREVVDDLGELAIPRAEEHTLAVDSSGLSVTTRGEYLAHRYKVRRGFVKLHAAVDVGTGAVVAATATGGRAGDAQRLPSLVREATKRLDGTIREVLADGAYDSRDNFDFLHEREIEAVVRMRKNANAKRRGGSAARPLAVRERNLLGEGYWRFVHGYGRRWAVEGTFSVIKRTLGENLRSRRGDLRLREAQRKAIVYNRLLMA
jgi:transposase